MKSTICTVSRLGVLLLVGCGEETTSPNDLPPLAPEATFEVLDRPDGNSMFVRALTPDGSVVVGTREFDREGGGTAAEAVRWVLDASTGQMGPLEGLGVVGDFRSSYAADVSDDGFIVVGLGGPVSILEPEALRWEGKSVASLGHLSGGNFPSASLGVSGNGSVVVGYSINADERREAFRLQGGAMAGLGFLPGGNSSSAEAVSVDGSVVVGRSQNRNDDFEAFRWEQGIMTGLGTLPGGRFPSRANAVSADERVVVGRASVSTGRTEAFRWKSGVMQGLGLLSGAPGDEWSEAYDVTADGAVVVGFSRAGFRQEAFIWSETARMQNLKFVLEEEFGLDLTGWALSDAVAISDDGTIIVGTGKSPTGDREVWRAFLGEPVGANPMSTTNRQP